MDEFDAKTAARVEDYPHVRVEIRPLACVAKRIPTLHEAKRTARACCVSRRGRDFPWVPTSDAEWSTETQFVQAERQFDEHFEIWRLYLSGQFVFKSVIRELVMPERGMPRSGNWNLGGPRISYGNWIWNLTEIAEFAYRLGSRLQIEDGIALDIDLVGIRDVGLGTWRSEGFEIVGGGVCLTDDVAMSRELPSPQVTTSYDEQARDLFGELLSHFDMKPNEALIAKVQNSLLSMRMGRDAPRIEAKAS